LEEREMNLQAYPLYWPDGWKRTKDTDRKNGQFSRREQHYRASSVPGQSGTSWSSKRWITVSDGVGRILESLERMGIDRNDVIISTNIRTRLDGLPRSGEREPDDPGAAVYWRKSYNAPMRCMGIDRYATVADNLAAISATLEAMRAIERHGGAEILDRTFQGFAALGDGSKSSWRETLGFSTGMDVSVASVEARFKELAKVHHPDAGGDTARFQEISEAYRNARIELTN
jgi:hypothetical protein